MNLYIFCFIIGVIYCNSHRIQACKDCFYKNVKSLAEYDALLASRLDLKRALVSKGKSENDFVKELTSTKSNGKAFSCGYTRSWEAELLQGLRRQYQEIKIKYPNGKPINYDASGYHIETGQKIVDLFTRNLENKHRILYLMEIVGPLDHVWMIEQLPNGKGYRIHQSYNNAYSLKAWLSSSLEGMWESKDIIVWHDVIKMANNFLKSIKAELTLDKLDKLPARLIPLKPWLKHIRDYNKEEIVKNLKTSWELFGKGKIMKKTEFFDSYLSKLKELTEGVVPLVGTSKPWSEKLDKLWVELFGSPNPVLYRNYPFNTLTLQYDQHFALRAKQVVVSKKMEQNCKANAAIIWASVGKKH